MANTKKILVVMMMVAAAILATGCSDDNPVNLDTAVDTAPPAGPSYVRATMDDSGSAVVTWAPNTVDSDLAGYVVTRENDGDVTVLVASPTLATSIEDVPPAGVNYYNVYAVDEAGNESAVSSALLVISKAHTGGEFTH